MNLLVEQIVVGFGRTLGASLYRYVRKSVTRRIRGAGDGAPVDLDDGEDDGADDGEGDDGDNSVA